jgi:hypothetical protein
MQLAEQLNLQRQSITGNEFSHTILLNRAAAGPNRPNAEPFARLQIYLAGDGNPWLNRSTTAADPTARKPLVMHLLAQDPTPALYLGRPCYDGFASEPQCSPKFWTSHRYSDTVISSMAAALKRLPLYTHAEDIRLIGYSGGGAIAMLLAAQLPRVSTVITLAGNLDHAAWTQLHGYSPLFGSLNPATADALPESITQLHFIAAQDRNIPPELFPTSLLRHRKTQKMILQGYSHRCCWLKDWPDLLKKIAQSE